MMKLCGVEQSLLQSMRPIFSDPKWPVLCRFLGGFCVAGAELRNSAHKRRLWPVITPKKRQKTPVVIISNKNSCDFSLF
jgi:hypothetical protein